MNKQLPLLSQCVVAKGKSVGLRHDDTAAPQPYRASTPGEDSLSVEVCLVQMPFAPLERPSIGLGLLKAALTRAGIGCQVVYANLLFAEAIGFHPYRWVEGTATEYLLGDWVFSHAAFPDFQPDHDEYLDLVLRQWPALVPRQRATPEDLIQQKATLWGLREAAGDFVDDSARAILDRRPRIVGCSSTFLQNCASLALLRRIRELSPGVVTMMGGANCEGPMGREMVQSFPWLDFVVSGEGDEVIVHLCRRILSGADTTRIGPLPQGVLSRSAAAGPGDGSDNGSARASVEDLDSLPTPDYDEYFQMLAKCSFRVLVGPGLLVEASRGCWWGQRSHCSFCGLNGLGMQYREKSPERTREELAGLSQRHGLTNFGFVDNVLSPRHVTLLPDLLESVERRLELFCETRASISRQSLQKVAAAGFRTIQPGIETLHDGALKLMHKGGGVLKSVELLKWSLELGVRPYWNLLCGLPEERDEWYAEIATWLPAIMHLHPPMTMVRVRFDRFSDYHDHAEAFGLCLVPYRTYRSIYPIDQNALARLAFCFEKAGDAASVNIWHLPEPGQQGLKYLVDEWKAAFHGSNRPRLVCTAVETAMVITDTRPAFGPVTYTLDGLGAKIIRLCRTSRPVGYLQSQLGAEGQAGFTPRDVTGVVIELKRRGLLLDCSGKLLALPVCTVGVMPPLAAFPFGHAEPPPARLPVPVRRNETHSVGPSCGATVVQSPSLGDQTAAVPWSLELGR